MLRRDLLLTLLATVPARWFRAWRPPALGAPATEEANAAVIYQKAFGCLKGLRNDQANNSGIGTPLRTMAIGRPELVLYSLRTSIPKAW